jgi:hypothetical protein
MNSSRSKQRSVEWKRTCYLAHAPVRKKDVPRPAPSVILLSTVMEFVSSIEDKQTMLLRLYASS